MLLKANVKDVCTLMDSKSSNIAIFKLSIEKTNKTKLIIKRYRWC